MPVRTKECGQDSMGSGLHLKHTSPEEAFMVQVEERRRFGDSFNRLDLNGKSI